MNQEKEQKIKQLKEALAAELRQNFVVSGYDNENELLEKCDHIIKRIAANSEWHEGIMPPTSREELIAVELQGKGKYKGHAVFGIIPANEPIDEDYELTYWSPILFRDLYLNSNLGGTTNE